MVYPTKFARPDGAEGGSGFSPIIRTRKKQEPKPLLFWLSCYNLPTVSGEALTAINRTVVLRNEGHAGGLAALSAHSLVHLARSIAIRAAGLAGVAAGLAASGLILETLFRVERLLTGGEHEFLATVSANQRLVFEHWNIPLHL